LLCLGLGAALVAQGAAPSSASRQGLPAGAVLASAASTRPPLPPFHFTPLGKVLGPPDFGFPTSPYAAAADMSGAVLPDGRVRLYVFVNSGHPGQGSIRSAISPDGLHFTAEPGIRVDGGQARVVPLDGGGWRLFFTTIGGIGSATSADGLTFVTDPGLRITNAQAGLPNMTVGSIVRVIGGGYRMYLSSSGMPAGGPPAPDHIVSASSTDLLNWTMEAGVRIGPGAPALTGTAVHPFALANRDGTVTLLYEGQGQGTPRHAGFFYSTSHDGLSFSTETVADLGPYPVPPDRLGTIPGDPDVIPRPDGSYLLYYDQFNPSTGTEIHAARVTSGLHARRVLLRLSRHVARGRVSVADSYAACRETVPLEIQRAAGKRWRTARRLTTFDNGTYRVHVKARSGKFRVRASLLPLDRGQVCGQATSRSQVLHQR